MSNYYYIIYQITNAQMQKIPSYIEYVNVYVHGNDLFFCMFICYSQ